MYDNMRRIQVSVPPLAGPLAITASLIEKETVYEDGWAQ